MRAVVQAIEQTRGCSSVVQHCELRCIKKTSRALKAESHKVADSRIAISHRAVLTYCAERSVSRIETASRSSLIQTTLGNCVDDQAGLITVFGGRRAGDHFQRLDRVGWQLS